MSSSSAPQQRPLQWIWTKHIPAKASGKPQNCTTSVAQFPLPEMFGSYEDIPWDCSCLSGLYQSPLCGELALLFVECLYRSKLQQPRAPECFGKFTAMNKCFTFEKKYKLEKISARQTLQ